MKKYIIAALLCTGLFSACERLIYEARLSAYEAQP